MSIVQTFLIALLIAAVVGFLLRPVLRKLLPSSVDPDTLGPQSPPAVLSQWTRGLPRFLLLGEMQDVAEIPVASLSKITLNVGSARVKLTRVPTEPAVSPDAAGSDVAGADAAATGPALEAGSAAAIVESVVPALVRIRANFPTHWSIVGGTIQELTETTPVSPHAAHFRVVSMGYGAAAQRESVDPARITEDGTRILVDGNAALLVEEDNVIEILVPEQFVGDLSVVNEGSQEIKLAGVWTGGAVALTATEGGDFSGGQFLALNSFYAECSEAGTLDFEAIEARRIDASLVNGNCTVKRIAGGERVEISFSGYGDLKVESLSGGEVIVCLDGDANTNVELIAVSTTSLKIDNNGDGAVDIGTFAGGRLEAYLGSSAGNLDIDTVDARAFSFKVEGQGDLNVGTLKATESAVLELTGDSHCNVEIETLEADRVRIESCGDGNVKVDNCKGGSLFEGLIEGGGNLSLGDTVVKGRFRFAQHNDGDSNVTSLDALVADLYCTDNGSLSVDKLHADQAIITNDSDYTIKVADGAVNVLTAVVNGSGDVDFNADARSFHCKSGENGSINLKN